MTTSTHRPGTSFVDMLDLNMEDARALSLSPHVLVHLEVTSDYGYGTETRTEVQRVRKDMLAANILGMTIPLGGRSRTVILGITPDMPHTNVRFE